MRILYLASWYPRPNSKNSGVFFRQLAEGIAENADEVIVACVHVKFFTKIDKIGLDIRKRGNITEYMWFVPAPIPRCRFLYDLLGKHYMSKLIKFIIKKHGECDIIHIQSAFSAAEYALPYLKKYNKAPLVYTEHSSKMLNGNLSKRDEKLLVQLSGMVDFSTAVSTRLANKVEAYIEKVQVVGNMINDYQFSKYNGVFTFLCLGTLRKAKGIDLLLNAFINEFSDEPVRLLIGGEGEYEPRLREIILNDNNKHDIKMLGLIQSENVVEFYGKGNCFVLPSQYETFGIVYIEAMACGLPVIATRCGGPEEYIDEKNGILIDVNDEAQLRTALRYMYENAGKYDTQYISENIIRQYGKRNICEVYNAIYKKLQV